MTFAPIMLLSIWSMQKRMLLVTVLYFGLTRCSEKSVVLVCIHQVEQHMHQEAPSIIHTSFKCHSFCAQIGVASPAPLHQLVLADRNAFRNAVVRGQERGGHFSYCPDTSPVSLSKRQAIPVGARCCVILTGCGP